MKLRYSRVAAVALILAGCSAQPAEEQAQYSEEEVNAMLDADAEAAANAAMAALDSGADPEAAAAAAVSVAASGVGGATVMPSGTFKGYKCTKNCSGHEAGWDWAKEHGIDDPDACGGKSNSFVEGCLAYASEHGGE